MTDAAKPPKPRPTPPPAPPESRGFYGVRHPAPPPPPAPPNETTTKGAPPDPPAAHEKRTVYVLPLLLTKTMRDDIVAALLQFPMSQIENVVTALRGLRAVEARPLNEYQQLEARVAATDKAHDRLVAAHDDLEAQIADLQKRNDQLARQVRSKA